MILLIQTPAVILALTSFIIHQVILDVGVLRVRPLGGVWICVQRFDKVEMLLLLL